MLNIFENSPSHLSNLVNTGEETTTVHKIKGKFNFCNEETQERGLIHFGAEHVFTLKVLTHE